MSYQDPTIQYPPPGAPEYQTMPLPQDDYVDDEDEEWVNQAPKGLRIAPITGILALVLFAVCGFWGGAVLQKHHDKSTRTTTTGAAAFAGLAAGRRAAAAAGGTGTGTGTGATGAGGGFGGRGGTAGTVSDVEGSTVFLTDSAGNILKVNLAPTTRVTKTTSAAPSDIQLGDSVIVTGAKGTDGSTAAVTVVIVPAGTTGLGGGGATGTTPTTTTGGG
jgi:hypothetical protein